MLYSLSIGTGSLWGCNSGKLVAPPGMVTISVGRNSLKTECVPSSEEVTGQVPTFFGWAGGLVPVRSSSYIYIHPMKNQQVAIKGTHTHTHLLSDCFSKLFALKGQISTEPLLYIFSPNKGQADERKPTILHFPEAYPEQH